MTESLALDGVLNGVWQKLSAAVHNPAAPMRLPVVATSGQQGTPSARTVVLRSVDELKHELVFYTDRRSVKYLEIEAQPRLSFVFYDPADQTQIRMVANAELHTEDDVADGAWAACPLSSRRAYLSQRGPGTTVPDPVSGLPGDLDTRLPTKAETEVGRAHFAVVVCTVLSVDWLDLNQSGHRRAVYQRSGDRYLGRWVIP